MKILSFAFSLLLVTNFLYSQEPEFINPDKNLELKTSILNGQINPVFSESVENISLHKTQQKKEKSTALAIVLSALAPGAGEIYAESYLKGAAFLAAEIGLWTMNIMFNNKGDNQTSEYQNYADSHWDVYKYAAWLKDNNFQGAEGLDLNADKETLRLQLNQVESQNFSHTLPPYGAQQYYEVIGKYQNFVAGWSSADPSQINNIPGSSNYYFNVRLSQVMSYMSSRQDANDYYQWADKMVMGAILNRVLSIADAAWTVSVFNKNLTVKTSYNVKNIYSHQENRFRMTPFANFQVIGF